MSFRQLGHKTGVFESAVCMGILKVDHGYALIDSGVDESATKKALQAIGNVFGSISAVVNTHAHADHIGGNSWLLRNRNVITYAPASEKHFIEHPELEPHYLFGCDPVPELNNKFYCAKPSEVKKILVPGERNLDGHRITLVDLKGHSPGMLGILTEDGIFHLGDAIMPENILKKHKLMFFHNLEQHLRTLDTLTLVDAEGFILSHGGYLTSINSLIELNRETLLDVSERIFCLTKGGMEDTDIHANLYEQLGIVENESQYYLNHAVIRGHLKYLKQLNRIEMVWLKGRILWRAL